MGVNAKTGARHQGNVRFFQQNIRKIIRALNFKASQFLAHQLGNIHHYIESAVRIDTGQARHAVNPFHHVVTTAGKSRHHGRHHILRAADCRFRRFLGDGIRVRRRMALHIAHDLGNFRR